ncbi:MAG: magnesium chelatase ATPase subunit I, partial [Novosphingobium sp.]
ALQLIARGQKKLAKIEMPESVLIDAAQICSAVGVDGLRGELTLMRAARAYAALKGARIVKRDHLLQIAPMALRHRLRRDVLDESGSTARIDRAIAEHFS